MPINLIDYTDSKEGDKGVDIGGLCEDKWEMPEQIEALEKWLKKSCFYLPSPLFFDVLCFLCGLSR